MISYDIIKRPVISERSMEQSAEKKYTFIVDKKLTRLKSKKL